MYAEGTMSREEFRKARREQVLSEQRARRRRILLFCVTILLVFGVGVCFGTLLARADETAEDSAYKYYTKIEVQKGDTLWEIADRYMDREHYEGRREYIIEVMNINHMTTDRLTVGKKLIVPYYSAEVK